MRLVRSHLRLLAIVTMVCSAVAFLVLVNADSRHVWLGIALVLGAALPCGAVLGWRAIPFPPLMIAAALPFGDANRYLGNEPDQVWALAIGASVVAILGVLVGAAARWIWDRTGRVEPRSGAR